MKIVYKCLSVLFAFLLFPFEIIVYADENSYQDISDNISYEYLCKSADAKYFNKRKKKITSFINDYLGSVQEDKHLIKNPVKFSVKDIDFQDNEKVKGVKIHGRYLSPAANDKYSDFQEYFSSKPYAWIAISHKGNTYVVLRILPYSEYRNDVPQTGDYTLNSKWIINISAFTEENYTMGNQSLDGYIYNHIDSEMTENICEIFSRTNKTNAKIKVMFLEFDDWKYSDCAVIFVDNKPKYVYFYTLFSLGVLNTDDDFSEKLDEKLWDFYEDELPIYNYKRLLADLNKVTDGYHDSETEFFF